MLPLYAALTGGFLAWYRARKLKKSVQGVPWAETAYGVLYDAEDGREREKKVWLVSARAEPEDGWHPVEEVFTQRVYENKTEAKRYFNELQKLYGDGSPLENPQADWFFDSGILHGRGHWDDDGYFIEISIRELSFGWNQGAVYSAEEYDGYVCSGPLCYNEERVFNESQMCAKCLSTGLFNCLECCSEELGDFTHENRAEEDDKYDNWMYNIQPEGIQQWALGYGFSPELYYANADSDAYSMAYNEGHSDARNQVGYRPNFTSKNDRVAFREAYKMR